MISNNLPIRRRIDLSCYLDPPAGAFPDVSDRAVNDADATLPSLGAPKSYGAVETYYFAHPTQRLALVEVRHQHRDLDILKSIFIFLSALILLSA